MLAEVLNDSEAASQELLKIAVLHNDVTVANRVKEILERVICTFDPICLITIQWWEVKSLRDKDRFVTSSRAASQADIVVVALNTTTKVSPQVKQWIPRVFTSTGFDRRRAVIALLETEDASANRQRRMDRYLRDQAESAGIDYLM